MAVRRPGARSAATNRSKAGSSKTPPKKAPSRPGIGGGKRGQRLASGLTSYESPNIAGEQTPTFGGAYNSGTTMDQIKRNEYLNTLSQADRERAMSQMGYWTGGVPTATPLSTKREIRQYAKSQQPGAAGVYLVPSGTMGVNKGQFEVDASGNIVKGSVQAYRPAKGKVIGPERGAKGKGNGRPGQGRPGAGRPNKGKGKGKGKGLGYGGAGETGGLYGEADAAAAAAASYVPYAEADTSTTSYRRAQGKAFGQGSGMGLSGQTSSPPPLDSSVVEGAAEGGGGKKRKPRKRTTRKVNKRGNTVVRTRRGGKVVSKRTVKGKRPARGKK